LTYILRRVLKERKRRTIKRGKKMPLLWGFTQKLHQSVKGGGGERRDQNTNLGGGKRKGGEEFIASRGTMERHWKSEQSKGGRGKPYFLPHYV